MCCFGKSLRREDEHLGFAPGLILPFALPFATLIALCLDSVPSALLQMSGSMMSVFSDNDIGNVEVRGSVQFSLYFDPRKRELRIQVIQCRDLAEAKKQRSDP